MNNFDMKERNYQMNYKLLTITHCLLPLFIGGALYILFRSSELKMFEWFNFLGLKNLILEVRFYFCEVKNGIPSWTYFSLPDALWVYSFTSSLLIYWHHDKIKYFWILLPLSLGVFIEILQFYKLFPGTFDFLDLLLSSLSFIFSLLIINHKFKKYEKTIS